MSKLSYSANKSSSATLFLDKCEVIFTLDFIAESGYAILTLLSYVVVLKFQTTAPKSCYMRPPGGILAPGGSLLATGNIIMCFSISSTLTFSIYASPGFTYDLQLAYNRDLYIIVSSV